MNIPTTIFRVLLLIVHSAQFVLLSFLVTQTDLAALEWTAGITLGGYALGATLAGISLVSKHKKLARYCAFASFILLLLLLSPAVFQLLTTISQSD